MKEWIVDLHDAVSEELAESFRQGPIIDDKGRRWLTEETIASIDGLKIQVFAREHPPPHFRVSYAGETNDFRIRDCMPIHGEQLKKFFRNIREWHSNHKQDLIKAWNSSRPTDCPVGNYVE